MADPGPSSQHSSGKVTSLKAPVYHTVISIPHPQSQTLQAPEMDSIVPLFTVMKLKLGDEVRVSRDKAVSDSKWRWVTSRFWTEHFPSAFQISRLLLGFSVNKAMVELKHSCVWVITTKGGGCPKNYMGVYGCSQPVHFFQNRSISRFVVLGKSTHLGKVNPVS